MNALKIENEQPEQKILKIANSQAESQPKKVKSRLSLLVKVFMKKRADLDLQTWQTLENRNNAIHIQNDYMNKHYDRFINIRW